MSLSKELLKHAQQLIAESPKPVEEVRLRKAISAAYYALFHTINGDAVGLIAPFVSPQINHRIQRWFDHAEMRKICARFTKAQLDQPLLGLVGQSASADLQFVPSSFIRLQEARHSADYDLSYIPDALRTSLAVELSRRAIAAWDRIAKTAEWNIFILSLLLWKNWERERLST